jgi:hypothetical protein
METSGNSPENNCKMMLLKTPSASDAFSEKLEKKEQTFGNSGSLAQEMATGFIFNRIQTDNKLIPTPQGRDWKGKQGRSYKGEGNDLPAKLEGLLPTPQASDWVEGARTAVDSGQACIGRTFHRLNESEEKNLLPTPRAGNPGSRPNQKGGRILAEQISLLTYSQAASRASRSRQQESERERKMTVSSGLQCLGLFPKQGPVGLLAKMLLGSSHWRSTKSLLSWKDWTTTSNVLLYQLAPSMRHTEGTEYGSSPMTRTPSAQEPGVSNDRLVTKDGLPAKVGERAYDKNTGRLAQVGLTQQVQMLLPTPQAIDGSGEGREPRLKKDCNRDPNRPGSWRADLKDAIALLPTPTGQEVEHPNAELTETNRRLSKSGTSHSLNLADNVMLLPTPRTCSAMGATVTPESANDSKRYPNLETVVGRHLLPTPAAKDWKGSRTPETLKAVGRLPSNDLESSLKAEPSLTGAETGVKLRLSPAFVEWMMGYPKGWLDFPMEAKSASPSGDRKHSKHTGTP